MLESMTLGGEWKLRQAGTDEWLPAKVPGSVYAGAA